MCYYYKNHVKYFFLQANVMLQLISLLRLSLRLDYSLNMIYIMAHFAGNLPQVHLDYYRTVWICICG